MNGVLGERFFKRIFAPRNFFIHPSVMINIRLTGYKPDSFMQDEKDQLSEEIQESPDIQPAAEESEVKEETLVEETVIEEDRGAHDDYDWTLSKRDAFSYTAEELKRYEKEYEDSMQAITESEVVSGKISAISESDVILDINFKSDGLVPLSEFRGDGEINVGDLVDVYVEQQEDERGQLVLSRRKAKLLRTWESLVDSYDNGTIIKGTVVSKTKGGLIVDAGGLETFLPGSQIDIKPIIDYDSYVGKTMEFKVVKINEKIKNAVVSHKALIESDLAEQREHIISSLEKGQVLEGIVKNLTDFGAFMDLGGVDGLLYITDISWGRINHPSEVLELNQKINVVVLDFDENKKRISLGLKQLQAHPWDVLGEEVKEGSTVKGKIVNIEDYGAFLEITPGVEGLIHVSEVTWSNQPINARDYFTLGQEFESKVVTIDREERKMSLSLKQLMKDPWSDIQSRFPLNSRHSGEVKNLTPYGVFVELEDGIGGMVHISDLSWTKRYSHPSEFTKVGDNIEVVILEIDQDSRKLSLGHKQIEENPWDTFESVFPIGSYHEATIVRRDDKGGTVQLPYGLEAFAPGRHLRKEDGSNANVDETLTFKVIEFSRDDKRILVSHTRYLEDIQREAEGAVKKEVTAQRKKTQNVIRDQQSKVERTTLGELDVFSQLKEQLSEAQAEKTAAKKEAETKPPVAEVAPEAAEESVVETPVEEVVEAEVSAPEVTTEASEEEAVKVEEPAVEEVVAETSAEEVVEEAVAKTPVEDSTDEVKADDLKKIEGIGPKIQQILRDAGIGTFEKLSSSDVDQIREILLAAGSRYKMFDPTTWPEQAKLAAAGDWDALKELQDSLQGGKR
jgi:small subunit ribosomal protein S1